MKKEFIINLALIMTTTAAGIAAFLFSYPISGIGAITLCLVLVYRQLAIYNRFEKLLGYERLSREQSQKKAVETEKELHFHKLLIENTDTAVMVVTGNGYAEWHNSTAARLIGENGHIPQAITEAVEENRQELTINGREYSLSRTRIKSGYSFRNIIVLKDIHDSIEKSQVESWHKLVRVLTHEIMNSMSPIISLSATLCNSIRSYVKKGDENIEEIHHGLEIINRRSSSLLSFIENYRKLTHLSAPQKNRFTIRSLAEDLQKLYTHQHVIFRIEAGCETRIYADRGQIEQVLINLIKNAFEACEEKARANNGQEGATYREEVALTFSVTEEENGRNAIIRIEDNGIGIMAPAKEQIFIPFFSTKKNGCGIGLSLCKQIIINHGGKIELESAEGYGCRVTCTIPIERDQESDN